MKNEESSIDWGHWRTKHESIPEDAIGFVYIITSKTTNEYYIGQKLLFSKITRPPLKGKKRKRRTIKDSNWRKYCSSSGVIAEDIASNEDQYDFEILSFHNSKTELSIEETRMIIDNINDPLCLNQIINIRVRVRK